jgi:hypothetical protein
VATPTARVVRNRPHREAGMCRHVSTGAIASSPSVARPFGLWRKVSKGNTLRKGAASLTAEEGLRRHSGTDGHKHMYTAAAPVACA